jgi:tetratricopeptide (TPR) repeat protein
LHSVSGLAFSTLNFVMSRFGNLEFGKEFEGEFHESVSSKDESYYLSGAQRAFEDAEFEKALRWYAKVLEFNPQNAAAYAGQVRALIELREFHEAKAWATKALEHFPHDPELLAVKAVALGRSGELEEAIAFSDAAVEERGETPYIWLARADVLLARKAGRADFCFDRALAMAQGDWFIAWLAARIRRYYRQFVAAVKLLQQALEWDATRFALWFELGQCQLALGLAGAAERSLRHALELKPDCTEARSAMTRASTRGIVSRVAGFWRRLLHP